MKQFIVGLLVVYTLACSGSAFAYRIQTHRKLSAEVVKASVLTTDSRVLDNLGLKAPSDKGQKFPNSKGENKKIIELIQDGSAFEDGSGRFLNHFYDPVNDRPLTLVLTYKKSPDWALEDRGIFESILFDQDNSFADTRRFFLEALTLSTQTERDKKWGRTFQGLGHVIH